MAQHEHIRLDCIVLETNLIPRNLLVLSGSRSPIPYIVFPAHSHKCIPHRSRLTHGVDPGTGGPASAIMAQHEHTGLDCIVLET